MSKQNQGGMLGCFWVLLGGCLLLGMFGKSPSSSSNSNDTLYMSSDEQMGHNYAQTRMRQEGYSPEQAKQAADAIIKFHRAQQNGR